MDYNWLKIIYNKFVLFFTNPWSCSIILNRTRNLFPAPAPNCLCPAGATSWSVTLLLNKTSPNILPLCKVMFPGSLHSLLHLQQSLSAAELGPQDFSLYVCSIYSVWPSLPTVNCIHATFPTATDSSELINAAKIYRVARLSDILPPDSYMYNSNLMLQGQLYIVKH